MRKMKTLGPRAHRMLRALTGWLAENNEYWGIPLGLLLFIVAPRALRWCDPTAGAYDAGVLHAAVFAVAAFMILKGVTWLLIRLDFPELYTWLDDWFSSRTFSLHDRIPDRRNALALVVYLGYLAALVILTVGAL